MPLTIGPYEVATPVVLAPMAGITNQAFRRLCREHGAGLYVSEMVTSRALLERNDESLRLVAHDPDERPRSVQLYGVDPGTVGAAVKMLVDEDRADPLNVGAGHLQINEGEGRSRRERDREGERQREPKRSRVEDVTDPHSA